MTRLAHAIPAAGLVVAGFAGTYALHAPVVDEAARRCTMSDAPSQIVVAVERDTQIPVIPVRHAFNSASGVAPGPNDSLLARPGTLMVSARVRLLRIDTATRRVLADAGVAGDAPMAFIQAQPYRADCRTIRHIDTLPWTVPGDTGYARATLTPRETWPDGVPVFAIAPSWSFPYPRQTGDYPISLKERDGMTFRLKAGVFPATLSSPLAYFNFSTTITRTDTGAVIVSWARANMDDARREPILSRVRSAVLSGDFARVRTQPSRLRGTYRVTMSGGDSSVTWEFRTVDRPAYRVPEWEVSRTLDDLLASPYSSGYSLVGYPADSGGTLPVAAPRPDPRAVRALVWLKAGDRLTSPEARRDSVLTGEFEFTRGALPPAIWRALDAFVDPVDSLTLALRSRTGRPWTDADDQAALPITIRATGDGGVRGDTTLTRGSTTLRVGIVRIDTVAVRRPF